MRTCYILMLRRPLLLLLILLLLLPFGLQNEPIHSFYLHGSPSVLNWPPLINLIVQIYHIIYQLGMMLLIKSNELKEEIYYIQYILYNIYEYYVVLPVHNNSLDIYTYIICLWCLSFGKFRKLRMHDHIPYNIYFWNIPYMYMYSIIKFCLNMTWAKHIFYTAIFLHARKLLEWFMKMRHSTLVHAVSKSKWKIYVA